MSIIWVSVFPSLSWVHTDTQRKVNASRSYLAMKGRCPSKWRTQLPRRQRKKTMASTKSGAPKTFSILRKGSCEQEGQVEAADARFFSGQHSGEGHSEADACRRSHHAQADGATSQEGQVEHTPRNLAEPCVWSHDGHMPARQRRDARNCRERTGANQSCGHVPEDVKALHPDHLLAKQILRKLAQVAADVESWYEQQGGDDAAAAVDTALLEEVSVATWDIGQQKCLKIECWQRLKLLQQEVPTNPRRRTAKRLMLLESCLSRMYSHHGLHWLADCHRKPLRMGRRTAKLSVQFVWIVNSEPVVACRLPRTVTHERRMLSSND